jgi:Domain of unknown function (DUF4190)
VSTQPPQVSPDGKFYWDGQRWVPNQVVLQPPVTSVVVYGPRTNSLAVGALIAGIASWVICPFIAAIVAVALGHSARGQIRRTAEGGGGMAMAGLILGYIQLIAIGLFILLFIGGSFFAGLIGASTRH